MTKVGKFLRKVHFLWSVPVSVSLLILMSRFILWYDVKYNDTIAPLDIGILHGITFVIVKFLCYIATDLFVMWMNLPHLFAFYFSKEEYIPTSQIGVTFNQLQAWQKQLAFYCVFFLLLFAQVQLNPTNSARALSPRLEGNSALSR